MQLNFFKRQEAEVEELKIKLNLNSVIVRQLTDTQERFKKGYQVRADAEETWALYRKMMAQTESAKASGGYFWSHLARGWSQPCPGEDNDTVSEVSTSENHSQDRNNRISPDDGSTASLDDEASVGVGDAIDSSPHSDHAQPVSDSALNILTGMC